MRKFILWVALSFASIPALRADEKPPRTVPLSSPDKQYRIVGKLGEPFGTIFTVQGVVVDGPVKGFENGPNLRVQRVNGRATQDDVQIKLRACFNDFGEKVALGPTLPKLEFGQTYEFEGFENGEFVGIPSEAVKRIGVGQIQSSRFYFLHCFAVYKGKSIEAIRWSPVDFVDRESLIEGRAESRDNKAYIIGANWRLLTDSIAPWPKAAEGKTVEGLGTIRKMDEAGSYLLDKGTSRLVRLQDQVGLRVALRGRAYCRNDYWYFDYRGTKLWVEHMEGLPGWSRELIGEPLLITGVLDEEISAAIDQIGVKSIDQIDSKKQFIVRKPALKRIDRLLAPERVEP
jgi:hypothetical protein